MNNPSPAQKIGQSVLKRYLDFYGGDLINGAYILIADELKKRLGGTIKTGSIKIGSVKIPHFWLVVGGEIVDPIYDYYLGQDSWACRKETIADPESDEPVKQINMDDYVKRYEIYRAPL